MLIATYKTAIGVNCIHATCGVQTEACDRLSRAQTHSVFHVQPGLCIRNRDEQLLKRGPDGKRAINQEVLRERHSTATVIE